MEKIIKTNKFSLFLPLFLVGFIGAIIIFPKNNKAQTQEAKIVKNLVPLSIEAMRQRSYPGSDLKIEETLENGSNYKQYIASYLSDGLKIYGLLTVPQEPIPKGGYPAIVFNHGYIPPEEYTTIGRYASYMDTFAKNGYVVFKSDYRGNGNSQGKPEGAYYSPAYATDVLNALSSVKKLDYVNPDKIGMWGHSLGGNITLRSLVVNTKDIKAAVIWGGVVGSYNDLINNWHRGVPFTPSQREITARRNTRQRFIEKYGTPSKNPAFWNKIDPIAYIKDITTPIQLDSGDKDDVVPVEFSKGLYEKLKAIKKTAVLNIYPGGDHNISGDNFNLAMENSLNFFNKYLK